MLYSDAALRPSVRRAEPHRSDISALWAQGISGDLPIVLARIDEADDSNHPATATGARILAHEAVVRRCGDHQRESPRPMHRTLQGSLEALVRGSQLRLSPDTGESGNIFCCAET